MQDTKKNDKQKIEELRSEIAENKKDCAPRKLPELEKYPSMQLSGLEPCFLKPEGGFQFVGVMLSATIVGNSGEAQACSQTSEASARVSNWLRSARSCS